jgi:hypothetical protein
MKRVASRGNRPRAPVAAIPPKKPWGMKAFQKRRS